MSKELHRGTRDARGGAVIRLLSDLDQMGVPRSGRYDLADDLGYQLYLNLRQLYEIKRLDDERRKTEELICYARARGNV
jgi:hypothetical protein